MTDKPEPLNVPVAAIEKGRGSEVRLALTDFYGRHVDLRTYRAVDASGELRPTTKGAALPIARLRELRAALDAADRQAVALGWLDPPGQVA